LTLTTLNLEPGMRIKLITLAFCRRALSSARSPGINLEQDKRIELYALKRTGVEAQRLHQIDRALR